MYVVMVMVMVVIVLSFALSILVEITAYSQARVSSERLKLNSSFDGSYSDISDALVLHAMEIVLVVRSLARGTKP